MKLYEMRTIVNYAIACCDECASVDSPVSCPSCHGKGSQRTLSRLAHARRLLDPAYNSSDTCIGGVGLIATLSVHDLLPDPSTQTVDVCRGEVQASGFPDVAPWFAACGRRLRTVADWLPPPHEAAPAFDSGASIFRGSLLPMPSSLYRTVCEYLTLEPPPSRPGTGPLQHKPAVGDLALSGDFVYGCCFGGTVWLPGFASSTPSDLWTVEGLMCGWAAWLPLRGGHLPVGRRMWLYNGAEWCVPATFRTADIRHYDSLLALGYLARMWWPTLSPISQSEEEGVFGCLAFTSGLVHSTAASRALSGAALVQACAQLLDPLEAGAPSAFGGSSLYLDGGRLARLVLRAWENNLQRKATAAGLLATTSVLYVLTSRRHNRPLHAYLSKSLDTPASLPRPRGQLEAIFRLFTEEVSLPYDQWQLLVEYQVKCDYEWFASLTPASAPKVAATVGSLGLALSSLLNHVLAFAHLL